MSKIFFLSSIITAIFIVGAGCASTNSVISKQPITAVVSDKRVVVDCSAFGKATPERTYSDNGTQTAVEQYIKGYAKNDHGYIPKNFSDVAEQSTLCGSIKDEPGDYAYLHSGSFYISQLSEDKIFGYFKNTLAARGCTVNSSQDLKALGGFGSTMTFSCKDGHGSINPDPLRQAYSINFDLNK